MRGLPRARRSRTGSLGEIGGSSVTGSILTSANCSSVSSILGTTSVEASRESTRVSDRLSEYGSVFVSNAGEVRGESLLDDIEGGGDELVLRRAAPGGVCPKGTIEIIRSEG
jgi:hypothetical protein